ncbi:MAG TPA: XdhC family protein [Dokdonella sp.]
MHAHVRATSDIETVVATPLGGQRAVVEGVRALAGHGEAGVLAVVVETGGSTYRKPGALILLDAGGVRVGALSGGCLEGELETAARAVLNSGVAGDVRFDTSGDEDRVFGSGTGCGGSTRVLLLPLPAQASPLREALLDADARGLPLRLGLATAPDQLGRGDAQVGRSRLDTRRYRFDRDGSALAPASALETTILIETHPALRLLLLGAGPETRPLLQLSRLLGWHVELCEHRQRWARFAEGSGIDRVHGGGPDALPALFEQNAFDAALVMNHNYLLDARCLTHLAATRIAYVGLLGPAARRDDLMTEIGGGTAALLRSRLQAPVGLPLGGEGAEAIALSIVAQLQNQLSRRSRDD